MNDREIDEQLERFTEHDLDLLGDTMYKYCLVAHVLEDAANRVWWLAKEVGDMMIHKDMTPLRHEARRSQSEISKMMQQVVDRYNRKAVQPDDLFLRTSGPESYDKMRNNSESIAHFALLLSNHCSDHEAAGKIEAFIRSLPTNNTFTEQEIRRVKDRKH